MGHYNWVEPVLTPSVTPVIMVRLMERTLYSVEFHNIGRFLHTNPCDVIDPKQPGDDIIICGPGEQLHSHGSKLLHACFRPVLQTRLREEEKAWLSKCIGSAVGAVSVRDSITFCLQTHAMLLTNLLGSVFIIWTTVIPTALLLLPNKWMLSVHGNEPGLCLVRFEDKKNEQFYICYLSHLFVFSYIPSS